MKEILAVIRQDKMNATKLALAEAGVSSFTARKVLGRGKGNVDYRVLQGAGEGQDAAIAQLGQGPRLIPKRMMTIVVNDERVQLVVETLIKTNQTNRPGDGKIFVLPVLDAVRVRTGEDGEAALGEED
jgi:nitrogen regulatory protein PII 2